MPAVTASRQSLALAIGLSAQRAYTPDDYMINSRLVLALLVLLGLLMLYGSLMISGNGRWLCFGVGMLLFGISIGLLGSRAISSLDRGGGIQAEPRGFTAELLSAAVNEMREGMLIIDSDMRVVASNRAAHDLFPGIEGQIDSRRLTELTRNPGVYDAFLDGVRGTERSGVNVEIYGPTRRVFDLRVIPLKLSHGGN